MTKSLLLTIDDNTYKMIIFNFFNTFTLNNDLPYLLVALFSFNVFVQPHFHEKKGEKLATFLQRKHFGHLFFEEKEKVS